MFRHGPVGYFRLGSSAPRRELREDYVQTARRRHIRAIRTPTFVKVATDKGLGVDHPFIASTFVRTDAGTGVDLPWLRIPVTDAAVGRESRPLILQIEVATDHATGVEARAIAVTLFPATTDHGSGVESPLVVPLTPVAATDHSHGVDSPLVVPITPRAATDHATGSEAGRIFAGIARGATYRDQQALGRYQVGDRIGLSVVCVGPTGPVRPDATPVVRILSPGLTGRGFQVPVEPTDRETPAVFRCTFTPGVGDVPGCYVAVFTYVIGGFPATALSVFEVVPGGHPSGSIISQYALPNPDAVALIAHTESGRLMTGRGPYLDDGVS